jgi:predicted hydrocarbon binding protein
MGESSAREHVGVYGDLLTSSSNSRAFALWSTQHDTGELHTTEESPNKVRIEIVGYEDPSREMCLVSQGYLKGVLLMNGVNDLAVEKIACVIWGDDRCAWRASWKDRVD